MTAAEIEAHNEQVIADASKRSFAQGGEWQ
jgi:hypothetical protein